MKIVEQDSTYNIDYQKPLITDVAVDAILEFFLGNIANPPSNSALCGYPESHWAESLLCHLYRYFIDYANHKALLRRQRNTCLRLIAPLFMAPTYARILLTYYQFADECDSRLTYIGRVANTRRIDTLAHGIRIVFRHGVVESRLGNWERWNSIEASQGISDMISLFFLSHDEYSALGFKERDLQKIEVCRALFQVIVGKLGLSISDTGMIDMGENSKYVFNDAKVVNIQDNSCTINNSATGGIVTGGTVNIYGDTARGTDSSTAPQEPSSKDADGNNESTTIDELLEYAEKLMGRAIAENTVRNVLDRANVESCGEEVRGRARPKLYPREQAEKALADYVVANKGK